MIGVALTYGHGPNNRVIHVVAKNRKLVRAWFKQRFDKEPENQVWYDEDGLIEAATGSGQLTESPLRHGVGVADYVLW